MEEFSLFRISNLPLILGMICSSWKVALHTPKVFIDATRYLFKRTETVQIMPTDSNFTESAFKTFVCFTSPLAKVIKLSDDFISTNALCGD